MKLPSNVLARLTFAGCVATGVGCESAADLKNQETTTEATPTVVEKQIEVEPTPAPAAAPKFAQPPAPQPKPQPVVKKPTPKKQPPKHALNGCGPCGMG